MLLSHNGASPRIHPDAWIAPNATVCGDVTIGPGCRILYGAQVIAEGGAISLGRNVIVLENAVLRSTARHDLTCSDHIVVGPQAHLVGCTIEDEVFIATGAAIFHGAHIGRGSEVRIHGVVHVRTRLEPGATVPIGWVAVGDPAQILPPDQHEAIWALQKPLNFPWVAYGLERDEANLEAIAQRLSDALRGRADDAPGSPLT